MKKKLDILFGKFVFSAGLCFKMVENEYLQEFVTAVSKINFDYKLMTRQTLASSIIIKIHDEIIKKKKQLLKGKDCVLLADGWKNKVSNKKYLVFALSNIHVPTAFLAFKDISTYREYGITLAEHFNEAIKYAKDIYGCEVYAVSTDNDSKIVCGAKLARSNKGKKLIPSTCSSHSGNLLGKAAVPEDFVLPVRGIVTFFRNPKFHTDLIKLGGSALKNFPDTRFCFARDMCESILKNLQLLRYIAQTTDSDIPDEIMTNLFDPAFEENLRKVVKLLTPLCKLINKCQDPRFSIADATEYWLSLELPIDDYDQIEKAYITSLLSARIATALKESWLAANLLHPKYRGALLKASQRASALSFLQEHLNEQQWFELNFYLQNEENFQYYRENSENPVHFWSLCGMSLTPNLSKFAISLMLIPSSTAQLEGIFSQWKYIHNKQRANLGEDNSASLIDIYHSMKYLDLHDVTLKKRAKKSVKKYFQL